jgi:methyltransferase-like protein/trans-aconitate methyltransferase
MEETSVSSPTSYDDVPYDSHPFPQSHPDRLATLAALFGMKPAPVTRCRVLELGCASGGNIIPMAALLPESGFVGVDLSAKQLEEGHKAAERLGLQNLALKHASILDVDASWGKFDYIITHGVYSWVPAEVQDKIHAVFRENLAPNGVGYVSYNVYPGWHMREMIRHMMLYHCGQFGTPAQKVQQARALLDFLARSVPTKDNHYGLLLKSELDLLKKCRDSYLYHEHLEVENHPIYFHQFADKAAQHGLQFLAEAEFSTMLTSGFGKEVADTLRRISTNIVKTEQYMDFVRNRMFRQTLVCHKEAQLKRNLSGEDVTGFLVCSGATPENNGQVDINSVRKENYKTPHGLQVQVSRPVVKAALAVLKEAWPRAVPYTELFDAALARLEKAPKDEKGRKPAWLNLASDLLQGYTARLVDFRTWQADYATKLSEKPKATKMARDYVLPGNITVNEKHESVALDAVCQHVVPLMDGTRDKAALLAHLKNIWKDGALVLRRENTPVTDGELAGKTLEMALDRALESLAVRSLLSA